MHVTVIADAQMQQTTSGRSGDYRLHVSREIMCPTFSWCFWLLVTLSFNFVNSKLAHRLPVL